MNSLYVRLIIVAGFLLVIVFSNVSQGFGKIQSPVVVSGQNGYSIQQSREGVPVHISKSFWTSKDADQEFIVIFDIRKDDVSVHISLQAGVAQPASQTTTFVSWTPEVPGEYQIRAFVISNITNLEVLENVAESRFNVMSDEDFMALYSDRPTSFVIVPVGPVPTSASTPSVALNEKQHLGNGSNAFIRDISVSDNGLYVIGTSELPPLRENPPDDVANELVFFAASNDSGLTFEPMSYLINNTRALTFARHPLVHSVNDTLVYVTWLQEAYYRNEFKLVLSKSLDGGRTFDHTINLDHGGVVFGDLDMTVSKDGKSLYSVRTEVYHYGEPLQSAVVFSKSIDYGMSFTPDQVILNYTGSEYLDCTQLAIQEANSTRDTNVYLTWRQDSDDHRMKVVFSASHDNGVTFSPPVVVRETYTEESDCPMFVVYGDDVYLAWMETKVIYKPEDPTEILVGDTDLLFVASRDNGRSFESPLNLSEGIGAQTIEPDMVVSEGKIYAVWRDTIPEVTEEGFLNFYGNAEVIMTRSIDGGRTFESPVNLSNNPGGSYAPDIAVHGNEVYVIWMESLFPSNSAEVSVRISNDGGKTFGDVMENIVGEMPEPISRPQILASANGTIVHIVWSQRPSGAGSVEMYALTGNLIEK